MKKIPRTSKAVDSGGSSISAVRSEVGAYLSVVLAI